MSRRGGTPVLLGSTSEGEHLKPVSLKESEFDEAWLQQAIHTTPQVLPISEIESDFGRPAAICTELPVRIGSQMWGSLDNLIVSDRGHIALVEVKLWRNPEARRKVVAQALDYAAAVFSMSFEELEKAVQSANHSTESLFQIVSNRVGTELDECDFIDAIIRNLKRGRALVLLVGDGIREDVEALGELLQSNMNNRFVFGLIELRPFVIPEHGTLIVPSVLAKTVLIERGVLTIDTSLGSPGQVSLTLVETTPDASSKRRKTLSEDEFFDLIREQDPEMKRELEDLISRAGEFGIYVEMIGSMNLKFPAQDGRPYNLASIQKNMVVDLGPSTWFHRTEFGVRYCEKVATMIGGTVKSAGYGPESGEYGVRRSNSVSMPRLTELLPEHADAWLEAMRTYIEEAKRIEAMSE